MIMMKAPATKVRKKWVGEKEGKKEVATATCCFLASVTYLRSLIAGSVSSMHAQPGPEREIPADYCPHSTSEIRNYSSYLIMLFHQQAIEKEQDRSCIIRNLRVSVTQRCA